MFGVPLAVWDKPVHNILHYILYRCFSGLMKHGIRPGSMLSVLLVPVVKNKTGKLTSLDNYRPIALASILSKVLEGILMDRLAEYIVSTDNQFGLRTSMELICVFMHLKKLFIGTDHVIAQSSCVSWMRQRLLIISIMGNCLVNYMSVVSPLT